MKTKKVNVYNSTSGITLLSLVVAVILMLILAFVVINITIGERGIFKQGIQARIEHEISQYIEAIEIARGDVEVDNLGVVTLDNLIKRIEEKEIIAGGKITKLDEEKAEAITKEGYVRVKLDTENYRARREETLKHLAKNIAHKVKRNRRPVALEPMNPYERRIIHSALQSDPYVTTHSEGEEPYRKVVVTLKK